MATKPTSLPEWNSGGANRLEPSSGRKAAGFATNDTPTAQELNWWMNDVYQWAAYVDGLVPATTGVAIADAHEFANDNPARAVLSIGASGALRFSAIGIAAGAGSLTNLVGRLRIPKGATINSVGLVITRDLFATTAVIGTAFVSLNNLVSAGGPFLYGMTPIEAGGVGAVMSVGAGGGGLVPFVQNIPLATGSWLMGGAYGGELLVHIVVPTTDTQGWGLWGLVAGYSFSDVQPET